MHKLIYHMKWVLYALFSWLRPAKFNLSDNPTYQYHKVPCSIVKYYPLLHVNYLRPAGHWFAYVLGPAKQRSSDILSPILTPVTKTSLNIVLSEPLLMWAI